MGLAQRRVVMKIKPSQPILQTSSGARNKRAARARALKARRVTARRLLAPEHFHASLRLNPQPSLWMSFIAGLQAALAVLIAVVLLRHSRHGKERRPSLPC